MTIRKQGSKFVVTSKAGRVLGRHETRAQAERQLRAVEANKRRK